jgi:hypothetical protein
VPYEHQLKMIVDGFRNTSQDFATWASFLDLRVDAMGGGPSARFQAARHSSPKPNSQQAYRPSHVSLQNAAMLLADVADCQAGMIADISKAYGPQPAEPDFAEATLRKSLGEPELLHLILVWQQVDIGIFKTFMRLYGLEPSDPPLAPNPGPGGYNRLCEVIVSWLTVIDTDANNFVTNHKFAKKTPPTSLPAAATEHDALANFERQYHRLVNNYLLLFTVLPYHLFGANP